MGKKKNSKKNPLPNEAGNTGADAGIVTIGPTGITLPPGMKIAAINITPPSEWPDAKRRLYANVEMSLLENPKFRHLSVLPPGCMSLVVEYPAGQQHRAAA